VRSHHRRQNLKGIRKQLVVRIHGCDVFALRQFDQLVPGRLLTHSVEPSSTIRISRHYEASPLFREPIRVIHLPGERSIRLIRLCHSCRKLGIAWEPTYGSGPSARASTHVNVQSK